MVTVYKVSAQGFLATRLHLPGSAWGNTVRERLQHAGYTVLATEEQAHPDPRDAAELARRDALLEWASPS